MVDHLDDRAAEAHGVEREHTEHHEAEVRHRGVRNQLLHVALHQRHQRAVDDADDGQHHDRHDELTRGVRKNRQRETDETVSPHLQEDRRQDHGTRCRRFGMRVGQPGVEREHGHLDGEAEEEAEEDPELQSGRDEMPDLVEAQHVERVAGVQPGNVEEGYAAVVVEVERQDREQHQHRPAQRVEEKLDGRVQLAIAAPDADEEVHRHEHHFPEDVEEEKVQRAERADHARLQQEQEHVVLLLAGCDGGIGRVDSNQAHQRRQQDQQQRDPVDAERVTDAQLRNPVELLAELEQPVAGPFGIERGPEEQRDREVDCRGGGSDDLDEPRVCLIDEEDDDQRADQRDIGDDRQNGKIFHSKRLSSTRAL